MPKSIGMLDIAPRLGAPELSIPNIYRSFAKASSTEVNLQVGKLSYESHVSKKNELYPL